MQSAYYSQDGGPGIAPAFLITSITIRETPTSGRGVFTSAPIPAGTLLLKSSDLALHTLYREYRREVCHWCFAYNRGQHWKLRDAISATGAVWCSPECEVAWKNEHRELEVIEALEAVESLLGKATGHKGQDLDVEMLDASAGRPDEDVVAAAWSRAEATAETIVKARSGEPKTKASKRAMQNALSEPPFPPILLYSMNTVLIAAKRTNTWQTVLDLAPSARPYNSVAALAQHCSAYLQLLCVQPLSLLSYCTPDILLKAVTRDTANSFGLRSLDDGGAEMFGYGVWPSASFWNHNCSPNVEKRRHGRTWEFRAARDVQLDEELCITYLGGDEKTLGVQDRRKRLHETWGFECACAKCVAESVDGRHTSSHPS